MKLQLQLPLGHGWCEHVPHTHQQTLILKSFHLPSSPGHCQQSYAIFTENCHILEGLWKHPASCPDLTVTVSPGGDPREEQQTQAPQGKAPAAAPVPLCPTPQHPPKANPATFTRWNFLCFINQLLLTAYCAFIGCLHMYLKISHAA